MIVNQKTSIPKSYLRRTLYKNGKIGTRWVYEDTFPSRNSIPGGGIPILE
jgi:hypothetical protein